MQIRFKKFSGSLSIYFALLITCIGVMILVLVEIARFSGLNSNAGEYTNLAEESLFAGYQPVLLEEYDMFWLDGGFGGADFSMESGEAEMEALLYDNLQSQEKGFGMDLYRMQVDSVSMTKYLLATDRDGKVFQSQAAAVYKEKMGEIGVEEILSRIQKITDAKNAGGNPQEQITSAESALQAIREQQAAQQGTQQAAQQGTQQAIKGISKGQQGEDTSLAAENPLEVNRQLRSLGVLSLTLPANAVLSGKSINTNHALLKRKCQKGTDNDTIKTGAAERILFQQYIKEYNGSFLNPAESKGLSYGTEYVIAGKGSDQENLEYVVKELLLIREAVNFLYLNTNQEKQAQALTAATVLAGVSANPLLVEAVKQGILAAWAYGESICDVKILLSGGKIPLQKTDASWNIQLSNLGDVVSGNYQGSSYGQDYEDYLQALMYTLSTKKASYRCMDLMEYTMKQSGYQHAKMDHMIFRMEIQAKYHTSAIFSSLLGEDMVGGYKFQKESNYCYQ